MWSPFPDNLCQGHVCVGGGQPHSTADGFGFVGDHRRLLLFISPQGNGSVLVYVVLSAELENPLDVAEPDERLKAASWLENSSKITESSCGARLAPGNGFVIKRPFMFLPCPPCGAEPVLGTGTRRGKVAVRDRAGVSISWASSRAPLQDFLGFFFFLDKVLLTQARQNQSAHLVRRTSPFQTRHSRPAVPWGDPPNSCCLEDGLRRALRW